MAQRRFGIFTRTVTFVKRYRQILFVLLKYGFDDLIANLQLDPNLDRRLLFVRRFNAHTELSRAARVRLVLEELGPTFVKMGQMLSTRSDLLPLDILQELAQLQDHVPPFPSDVARRIIAQELGACEEIFADFEENPLAAGSIGQVHRARLHEGDQVAVKIQRPGIRRQIRVDLEIIHYLATLMERHLEQAQVLRPTKIAEVFARTLEQELDFSIESANMHRFIVMFEQDKNVKIPHVYRQFSTSRILTTEFVKGIKPTDREAMLREGVDMEAIANRGADLVITQVFIHGFFHGDPHPGNLLVVDKDVLCFLDFGMVGRIDHQSRELFADLLIHVVSRDETRVVDILLKLTHGHHLVDRQSLERDIGELIDQYLYLPLKELQIGRLIRHLLDVTVKYELQIPAQYFLLIKAISQIEDLARNLYPEFDFTERAGPIMRRLLVNRYHPKRLARDFYEAGSDLVFLIRDMPGELRELLKQARLGKFKVEIDHQRLQPMMGTLERVSNRVSSAIVLGAMIVGSSVLVHAHVPPVLFNIPVIGLIGFFVSGFMGLTLLRSMWKSRNT